MPELPEIITIREDLKREILGKKVSSVKKEKSYNLKHPLSNFQKNVIDQTVVKISNIAKLLLIKFSSGDYIATHLNMSGNILFNNRDPYTKISLKFDDATELNYSTVRMFGYFEVWPEYKVNEYRSRYGKTAIESDITAEEFFNIISTKAKPIKNVLLDQKLVSGIGNIYACDSLFMSGIHPKRKANSVTKKEYKELFENVQKILKESVKHRGSSIDRYRDIYGKKGEHQNFFRVYGKKNQSCTVCSNPITFEKLQGRGTYFCETCQSLDTRLKLL